MIWLAIHHIFSILISLAYFGRMSESEKELEIIILRHQLDVMVRKQKRPIRPDCCDKVILATLAAQLKQYSERTISQWNAIIRIVRPETVLRWHREMVRRKWSYRSQNRGGRPKADPVIEQLVLRLAGENGRWGYARIEGELKKLGHQLSITAVRNILKRHGITPAPVRFGSIGWRNLMTHYKDQLLACDFFTVETISLQTIYVFVFIELGSRRIHLAGVSSNPNGLWVAQQARQLCWQFDETGTHFLALIRDNDSKFTSAFDAVFESQGIPVISTPIRAPNANAFMERWVRTVREECLDHLLILNERHLSRVLVEYIDYYNRCRPHQGLAQESPISRAPPQLEGTIQKRKVLGGIINDYYRASTAITTP